MDICLRFAFSVRVVIDALPVFDYLIYSQRILIYMDLSVLANDESIDVSRETVVVVINGGRKLLAKEHLLRPE